MLKFKILDMNNFLNTVNACKGEVLMRYPEGGKVNIRGQYRIQNILRKQFSENKNCLPIVLECPDSKDYMSLVSYYAGDC